MRVLRVEIIVRTVEVGRHAGDSIPLMLDPVRLAHLDPRDLGDGVPLVGGLEWAGEESGFWYGLRSELGVDAGGAEEEEFLDAVSVSGVDHVGLDLEIDGDEVGWVGVVGVDPTDFGGGEDDVSRLLCGEEGFDVGLVSEVEVGMCSEDEIGETGFLEFSDNCGSDKSSVSSDEDFCGFLRHKRIWFHV